ncbi:type II secretion system protein [Cerasicoccus frondis]|uniref:type II secretion system protein n=1 Tax=Cerasicoccus frondis TaxID=490090 RepID=UPI002852AF79|nr:type II secretion system protein [Cerasicoccus frondis]
MKRTKTHKKNAFTLVELIVGMALAGMVFAGAFSGMKTGFDIVEQARDQARVTQLLQSEIERLRTLNFNDISSLPPSSAISLEGSLANAYRNRYSLNRVIKADGLDRVEVTVTANWTNSGRSRELSMKTGFTRDGLNDYYYRAF